MDRNHFLVHRKLRTPYLIQRAQIRQGTYKMSVKTLSSTLELDYMGSAEFEFGALPASIRAFFQLADEGRELEVRILESIQYKLTPLKILSVLTDAEFEEYAVHLQSLFSGTIRTKEWTNFSEKELQELETRDYGSKTNLWWDIDNNVFFSFKGNYMHNVLPAALRGSYEQIVKNAVKK